MHAWVITHGNYCKLKKSNAYSIEHEIGLGDIVYVNIKKNTHLHFCSSIISNYSIQNNVFTNAFMKVVFLISYINYYSQLCSMQKFTL